MKLLYTFLFCITANFINAQPALVFTEYNLDTVTLRNSFPKEFINYNGKFLFAASTADNGNELWISDGTKAGTKMVKDIYPGLPIGGPEWFTPINGLIVFAALDTNGEELWITDGTTNGTQMLKNIHPDCCVGSQPRNFFAYNGKVYFHANDSLHGNELWVTDGTTAGTQMFMDIYPGFVGSDPGGFTLFNGKMFFSASDSVHGHELWMTDGTISGTQMVKDINYTPSLPKASSLPYALTQVGNQLFFKAQTQTEGKELWVTDGTVAGTHITKDIQAGAGYGVNNDNKMIAYNGKVFFSASNGIDGFELWESDGTASGTRMVKDINPGNLHSLPNTFFIFKNRLFFGAEDNVNGKELWSTDGTSAGTKRVKNLNTSHHTSWTSPTIYKNYLYFVASGSNIDHQLWQSDGTEAGTKIVAPSSTLVHSPLSAARQLFLYERDSALYFCAGYTSAGHELWSVNDTSKSVGINTITHNAFSFSLYPNPNNGTFTLVLDNTNFTTGSLQVYDALGRRIHEQAVTDKTQTIRLQQPAGNYWVKLQLDDAVLTKQLVVE